ncbi:iron uptake transporter deferrochelatase/peroxidase subunit [Actinomyces sp. oral taxon 170]|uniref:iron uptake transporter deferrochelatase/peroxidase subunit n=1 Tax=Actinomyces sp. oral taxon 170 TaxID=712117 RepID=UPI000205C239|nr:iron uptake transporter deferrochelatase/peroxidase subunit [Actinomyces sp. oral taxon 170]EGF56246.1 Tat-translocated enzyme [Actinomyces sp. oral taxon 170 str. F0386]
MSGKPADESETSPVADDATEPEAAQAKQEPEGSTSESPGDGPQTSGASGEPETPDASEQPGRAGKPGDLGKPGRSGAKGTSRRAMFTGAGLGAALAGLAGVAGGRAWEASQRPEEAILTVYPFRGDHQAGITTPAQDNMFTAAFDVSTTDVEELKTLLSDWAVAAEQMTSGELVGGQPSSNKQLPPKDTGEAWGYKPNGLTITFGVGKGLFVDAEGNDRFGLAARMPAILKEGMPSFSGDQLHAAQSDGDLLVQACSNDAQVCVHAIRNLTRIAFGTAALRWSQVGYGRTSSTSVDQETPRNLFGFKDGTNNIKAEDSDDQLNEHLWVQKGDDAAAEWMTGGTYYVARRIHMLAEVWDRLRLIEQEQTMGRDKRYGAPLSIANPTKSSEEFTAVDYEAKDDKGETLVPADAHIAVVSPEQNQGRRMLRRGYNYTDGSDSLGLLQTGLFFIAFVRDPRTNFYPILDRMTKSDALQEYLKHEASALFAIPPGIKKGDTMVAASLFS